MNLFQVRQRQNIILFLAHMLIPLSPLQKKDEVDKVPETPEEIAFGRRLPTGSRLGCIQSNVRKSLFIENEFASSSTVVPGSSVSKKECGGVALPGPSHEEYDSGETQP